jgi:actin-like ATPase involved in cell morphogenesis
MKKDKLYSPAVGLDLGTMNIVAARKGQDGITDTDRVRDAFIDLDLEAKKTLKLTKVNYMDLKGRLIVIGDHALDMVNLFHRELRRPLSRGVIAAGELDAQEILSLLIKHVLGDKPLVPGEHCFYSVPAAPIDDLDQDVHYHSEVFRKILTEQGYTAHPMNEAMAIIYGQCTTAEDNFSGLAVSFGSGMINVALAYQTVSGLEFSLARGGDWIDTHAAKAVGSTAARMCAVKEKGVNLASPKTREEEAIVLYIRSLIRYCLENIGIQFKKIQSHLDLPEPIPFIISGGTSKAEGFLDVFREEFETLKKKGGFPIQIREIRPATNPMTAVAEGLLVLAYDEQNETAA